MTSHDLSSRIGCLSGDRSVYDLSPVAFPAHDLKPPAIAAELLHLPAIAGRPAVSMPHTGPW